MNGLPGSEGIFSKFGLRLFFGVNYYYYFFFFGPVPFYLENRVMI